MLATIAIVISAAVLIAVLVLVARSSS